MSIDDIPDFIHKQAALEVNQHGIELTPDQAHELGNEALDNIREEMKKLGYDLPESNIELIRMMRIAFGFEKLEEDTF